MAWEPITAGVPFAVAQATSPTTTPVAWLADRPVVVLGLLLGLAGDMLVWFWWRRVYTKGYKKQHEDAIDGWENTGDYIDPPREAYPTFLAWALQPLWKTGGEDPDLIRSYRKERVIMPLGFLFLAIAFGAVAGFALNYTIPMVGGAVNAILSLTAWGAIGVPVTHVLALLVAVPIRIAQRVVGAGRTVASSVTGDGGAATDTSGADSAFASGRAAAEPEVETGPSAGDGEPSTSPDLPVDPDEHTVPELESALEAIDDPGTLRTIEAAEREGKNRVTAKEAIQRRIREVTADADGAGQEADATGGATAADTGEAGDPSATVGAGDAPDIEPADVETDADIEFADIERGERIGSGGNAEVYRATWHGPDGDRAVALKTPNLPSEETVDVSFFERFDDEAATWARLDDHPNVVGVLDWGLEPHPWLALELLEGGNLAARAPLSPGTAAEAVLDVADAVRYAHDRGVVHNDLKPANVLFTDDGTPKVGDWGLAKVLLDHSMTSSDGLSPAYAAPEQFEDDDRDAGDLRRVDVYQLGALAYEALTGDPPFEGSTFQVLDAVKNEPPTPPSEATQGLPAAVDDVLGTAMAKDPTDRQPTVVHFVEAFEEATAGIR